LGLEPNFTGALLCVIRFTRAGYIALPSNIQRSRGCIGEHPKLWALLFGNLSAKEAQNPQFIRVRPDLFQAAYQCFGSGSCGCSAAFRRISPTILAHSRRECSIHSMSTGDSLLFVADRGLQKPPSQRYQCSINWYPKYPNNLFKIFIITHSGRRALLVRRSTIFQTASMPCFLRPAAVLGGASLRSEMSPRTWG